MNHSPQFSSALRRALLVLLFFGAVSSLAGGVLGVFGNGAGVPLSYLEETPFTSYRVPGAILAVVIGGTQLAAAIGVLRRNTYGYLLSAVAGFGMMIWIFVELALMSEYSWLQTFYFAVGVAEVALVCGLLGILETPGVGVTEPSDEQAAISTPHDGSRTSQVTPRWPQASWGCRSSGSLESGVRDLNDPTEFASQ